MCEELPAARRRRLLRTGLVGVRLGSAAKEACPVGLLCSLLQAFLSPRYPQESAGKLKGWGSEMVSLSATRNLSSGMVFLRGAGTRVCHGRVSVSRHLSLRGPAAITPRGRAGTADPIK